MARFHDRLCAGAPEQLTLPGPLVHGWLNKKISRGYGPGNVWTIPTFSPQVQWVFFFYSRCGITSPLAL